MPEKIQSILGPCSVHSYEQLRATVEAINPSTVPGLVSNRGPLEKPRTGDQWTGLGSAGVPIIRAVKDESGCRISMEATTARSVEYMIEVADDLWLGSRQNPNNTMEIADALKGVKLGMFLVKNPYAPDEKAWIGAIEVIKKRLDPSVRIAALFRGFCERIRTPGVESWRNNPDIEMVNRVVKATGVEPWIDLAHLIGDKELILKYLANNKLNPFWTGIMLEVDAEVNNALTDKKQTLLPEETIRIVKHLQQQRQDSFDIGLGVV